MDKLKAVTIFIFVSHPREGRFLANFQEKKTKKDFEIKHPSVLLICHLLSAHQVKIFLKFDRFSGVT